MLHYNRIEVIPKIIWSGGIFIHYIMLQFFYNLQQKTEGWL